MKHIQLYSFCSCWHLELNWRTTRGTKIAEELVSRTCRKKSVGAKALEKKVGNTDLDKRARKVLNQALEELV